MDPVLRLILERACERLLFDYAALVDAADWNSVAALYTPDGRMARPTAPNEFINGRDAILASFLGRPPRVTRHICTNIRIVIEDDWRATAQSKILLFTKAGQPPLVGSYADIIVDPGAGWRFSERCGNLDFT